MAAAGGVTASSKALSVDGCACVEISCANTHGLRKTSKKESRASVIKSSKRRVFIFDEPERNIGTRSNIRKECSYQKMNLICSGPKTSTLAKLISPVARGIQPV